MTSLVTTRLPQTPSALDAAFADFLRIDLANGDASEDTIRNFRCAVGLWVAWCRDQGLDPATVTTTHVKRYRQALIETGYINQATGW
jgi:site-specific recombinase XerD